MIREVTMYRVECDHDGCDDSPQDGTDFFAYTEPQMALDDASNGDWYQGESGAVFCREHAPRCADDDCNLILTDDEWGVFCEDHAPEEVAS